MNPTTLTEQWSTSLFLNLILALGLVRNPVKDVVQSSKNLVNAVVGIKDRTKSANQQISKSANQQISKPAHHRTKP